ncbi:MAG TPA: bifunctional UDP-N-acetylglucosamine diphosphorylase/glucosamine-1-phosphate N-acetyltransferase GlmU [Steroidobacteraceae bacterium]|jgi:bifunctional UDP-N-acetylglucosamine pyrophosphorylase/glucosamine-1-phosphate N-acetyltransferase|nr:bifunctional UDP-N-acetylglucosamine diphosphorylase/glucosamine-1-phosphate N-acetyltransferase GlmU [Steroidobacteraceae bacterium]
MPRKDPRRASKAATKPKQKTAAAERVPKVGPLSVVILAAGRGTRMKSDLPKVLQPLAGAPLLAHVLDIAAQLTPATTHVVYGHGAELVRDRFVKAPVQWALQSEQRGTGHALQQAMPAIPDGHRVLVLYGDVPLLRLETLQRLVDAAGDRAVALLTASPPDAAGYGRIVRNARGAVQRIVEHADASARERSIHEINSGVLIAPAGALRQWLAQLKPRNAQRELYLTDIVALALRSRFRVTAIMTDDPAEVQGVNDRMQLAEVEAEYRRRRARALMQAGATLVDPARLDVRGEVTVGRDVMLDVNVVLHGPVHLADRVRIGPNCVIDNASIGPDTILHANCVVQNARIGAHCRIGPFTRVRPETQLAAGVHLGNFVEVKNSVIGAGSKANHLTYIGDSEVGSGVNVGAGTITCNYDGANKWRTEIGDGAFIGSGAMLVAPVKVGEGATIGAGSTITSDAPAGKLTLARGRQVTIEQWQRPVKNPRKA